MENTSMGNMMKKTALFFTVLLFGTISIAQDSMSAADSMRATETMSAQETMIESTKICAVCHGDDGIGVTDYVPNLRGQKKGYFVNSLKAYQKRQRSGGVANVMHQIADDLSDEDINNIAEYYSNLK